MRLTWAIPVAFATAMTFSAGVASAASKDAALAVSMASALLKAKTQVRILKHDDSLAAGCYEKTFSSAEIVTRPVVEVASYVRGKGDSARKWQEHWVLDRCGTKVGYRVFFTDVGNGGAYFSFRQLD